MKGKLIIGILLSTFLVACQSESEGQKVEHQKEAEIEIEEKEEEENLLVKEEENFIEYEWKTNYAFILEQYIASYDFLNIEINPFHETSSGVVAAEIIYSQDREEPYLAILYASDTMPVVIPSVIDEELSKGRDMYIDIWAIQNGELVRIAHIPHSETEQVSSLIAEFKETEVGKTWIEDSIETKSIAKDLAPIIPNVLATLEALSTQDLQAPAEVLPIEEQMILTKLLSFELFEDTLINTEKINFANAIYAISGATPSEDYFQMYYPKAAMDYYSESNFDFTLDEQTFPTESAGKIPSYQDGVYSYPILGDYGIRPDVYVVDLLKVEKVSDKLYQVQFDQFDFEFHAYEETGLPPYDPKYAYLPKSKWPEETYAYMQNQQTKYALFKKNKYGFAMLEKSSSPIENMESYMKKIDEQTIVQMDQGTQEKARYLRSLTQANQLFEMLNSADSYEDALLEAHDEWDDELNKVYGMLREKLRPAEMEQLKQEQLAWIRARDDEAGEVENNHHWEVRLEYTMNRTNDLIDLYFDEE